MVNEISGTAKHKVHKELYFPNRSYRSAIVYPICIVIYSSNLPYTLLKHEDSYQTLPNFQVDERNVSSNHNEPHMNFYNS